MGEGAAWNYIAMQEAIADAKLGEDEISHPMTGIIMGSGGPSTETIVMAADKTRDTGGTKKIGPTQVPKAMSSTNSATLAVPFQNSRGQLFNFIRLRHIGALYRRCC